ncbi:hypothetical protein [Microbulbifer sp. ALW1]|uniref:hypothetical protein n=1 Tax=Microbulbifer sp. (strain ALW1) TaxID=1516059 RepID=UPI0013590E2D|nr:hypothetical protein [Microbulbifer sp. ALW1]
MAHISKQLLAAVTMAVTGLPSTGDRVQQSRTYAHHKAGPALNVRLGERRPTSTLSNAVANAEQDIFIDIAVAGPADTIDDLLLDVDAEIHQALMADYSLGLGFVLDCNPQGLSEPDLEQAEKPKAVATSAWRYEVRHNRTTLET